MRLGTKVFNLAKAQNAAFGREIRLSKAHKLQLSMPYFWSGEANARLYGRPATLVKKAYEKRKAQVIRTRARQVC